MADVNANDFDAVFYPGGHGPLWDLANDLTSVKLIETFNEQEKPIAFVCHAPAALKRVSGTDGNPLVKGKFLVEDMLQENGGIYSKKEDWAAYAVQDGNLITGQNPASSELVAEKLLAALK